MEDAKCETCKKWLRINNYKGFCSKNPDADLEYTYEGDWCVEYLSYEEFYREKKNLTEKDE